MKPLKKWVKRVILVINVTALVGSIIVWVMCLMSFKYQKDWFGLTLSIAQILFFIFTLLYFSEKIPNDCGFISTEDEDYDLDEGEDWDGDDSDPVA